MLTEDNLDEDKLNRKSENEYLKLRFSMQAIQLLEGHLHLSQQELSNRAIQFGIRQLFIRMRLVLTL